MSERQHSVPAGGGPPDHRIAELVRDWTDPIAVERGLLPDLLDAFIDSLPDGQTVLRFRAIRAHLLSGGEDEQHTVDDGVVKDPRNDIGFYRAGGGDHLPPPSTSKLPVISLLRDGRIGMTPKDVDDVISEISAAIAIRSLQLEADRAAHAELGEETRPGIVWSGRDEAGQRLSYGPDLASNLEVSMRKIFTTSTRNLGSRCEAYLSRFVRWNPKLFPELMGDAVEKRPYQACIASSYKSTLEILEDVDGLSLGMPLDISKREKTCEVLVKVLVKRFQEHCKGSHLLKTSSWKVLSKSQKKRLRRVGRGAAAWKSEKLPADVKFCLREPEAESIQYNFEDMLKSCFSSDGAPSEAILAGMEQKIWLLATHEPRSFPELFGEVTDKQ